MRLSGERAIASSPYEAKSRSFTPPDHCRSGANALSYVSIASSLLQPEP